MTKRPESVLVIIFTPQADVLLLQRADYPAFWQSVTGSLEANETQLEAAWRELKEETALNIENGVMKDCHLASLFEIYPQWRHRYAPSVTQNKEHILTFEIPKIIPITLSHEHLAYRWLSKDEAYQLASSPSNQEAIKTLIKGNEKHGRS